MAGRCRPSLSPCAKIKAHDPCENDYRTLRRSLGKGHKLDDPITARQVYEALGLGGMLWGLHCLPEHHALWRHYAVDCAERVKHLMADERSLNALTVARKHAQGEATDEELDAARDAAWAAEHKWQAERLIQLCEAGECRPVEAS